MNLPSLDGIKVVSSSFMAQSGIAYGYLFSDDVLMVADPVYDRISGATTEELGDVLADLEVRRVPFPTKLDFDGLLADVMITEPPMLRLSYEFVPPANPDSVIKRTQP